VCKLILIYKRTINLICHMQCAARILRQGGDFPVGQWACSSSSSSSSIDVGCSCWRRTSQD